MKTRQAHERELSARELTDLVRPDGRLGSSIVAKIFDPVILLFSRKRIEADIGYDCMMARASAGPLFALRPRSMGAYAVVCAYLLPAGVQRVSQGLLYTAAIKRNKNSNEDQIVVCPVFLLFISSCRRSCRPRLERRFRFRSGTDSSWSDAFVLLCLLPWIGWQERRSRSLFLRKISGIP